MTNDNDKLDDATFLKKQYDEKVRAKQQAELDAICKRLLARGEAMSMSKRYKIPIYSDRKDTVDKN
jgi:hypothetical protein